MLRGISRFFGYLLAALALASASYGLYQLASGEPLLFAQLGELWYRRYPTSLQLLQPALERHIAVWLWDPVMLAILTTPTWIVISSLAATAAFLGAVLILIGRRKRPSLEV
jgi:hypothetical protein